MKATPTLTTTQLKDLRELAKAIKAANAAADLRKRFKAFVDDNEDALRDGFETDGLRLVLKLTKQLTVEELS